MSAGIRGHAALPLSPSVCYKDTYSSQCLGDRQVDSQGYTETLYQNNRKPKIFQVILVHGQFWKVFLVVQQIRDLFFSFLHGRVSLCNK